jgi:hypothetical protein
MALYHRNHRKGSIYAQVAPVSLETPKTEISKSTGKRTTWRNSQKDIKGKPALYESSNSKC